MKVVTVANRWPDEPYYLHREFLESLRRFGHEPLILGTSPGEYRGLGSKPRLLKKAIESGAIGDEHMIFCDAFDVVFAESPELILARSAEHYGEGIVWNAERSCFPDASLAEKHPSAHSSFRYLNSGFGVGKTSDFLKMLEWMKADEIPDDHRGPDGNDVNPNDQDYVMRALVFGGLGMKLDTLAALCQTLCGVSADEFDFVGSNVRNRETGTAPMAFHWNGPAKTNGTADPILRKLGLR